MKKIDIEINQLTVDEMIKELHSVKSNIATITGNTDMSHRLTVNLTTKLQLGGGLYEYEFCLAEFGYEPGNLSSILDCIDKTQKAIENRLSIADKGVFIGSQITGCRIRFKRKDQTIIDEFDGFDFKNAQRLINAMCVI